MSSHYDYTSGGFQTMNGILKRKIRIYSERTFGDFIDASVNC